MNADAPLPASDAPSSTESPNSKRSFSGFGLLARYAELTVVLAIIGTLCGIAARFHFVFDLCTHARFHASVAVLICLPILWKAGRWKVVAAGCALVVFLGFAMGLKFPVRSFSGTRGDALTLMTMNVHTSNTRKQEAVDYILEQAPTFVAVLETDLKWFNALRDGLGNEYPYFVESAHQDNFGICFFSRIKLTDSAVSNFGGDFPPTIDVSVELSGQSVRIIGTHPVPPMNSANWHLRNAQMDAIVASIADKNQPTLLAGDLNCSPWSPFFADWLNQSRLKNAGDGFIPWPTWYPRWFLPGPAIDHVFASSEFEVADLLVGPNLGSDHRAVTVAFRLPE